jgi:hypothetical protein
VVQREDATLLVVSDGGMGKRTAIDAYRLQGRGGKGVINLKTNEKTGKVVAIKSVIPEDQLMVITRKGVINRQRIDEIRVIGRATQGVRLVNLDKGDVVMDVARVIPENENGDGDTSDPEIGPDGEAGGDAEGAVRVEVEGGAVAEAGMEGVEGTEATDEGEEMESTEADEAEEMGGAEATDETEESESVEAPEETEDAEGEPDSERE